MDEGTQVVQNGTVDALAKEAEAMAEAHASLSISTPNEKWIQGQIDSGEYSTASEVINDLIRKARETETIRAHLIAAEQSGFSTRTPQEALAAFRERARNDGKL